MILLDVTSAPEGLSKDAQLVLYIGIPVVLALLAGLRMLWMHGKKKDENYRADVKEFTKDFRELIQSNTESNVALKSAVEANTKATERLPDTVHLAIHKALPK